MVVAVCRCRRVIQPKVYRAGEIPVLLQESWTVRNGWHHHSCAIIPPRKEGRDEFENCCNNYCNSGFRSVGSDIACPKSAVRSSNEGGRADLRESEEKSGFQRVRCCRRRCCETRGPVQRDRDLLDTLQNQRCARFREERAARRPERQRGRQRDERAESSGRLQRHREVL